VDADRGKNHRHAGECDEEEHDEPLLRHRVADGCRERLHAEHRELRIDLANRGS
jgi:hypothetical protein